MRRSRWCKRESQPMANKQGDSTRARCVLKKISSKSAFSGTNAVTTEKNYEGSNWEQSRLGGNQAVPTKLALSILTTVKTSARSRHS